MGTDVGRHTGGLDGMSQSGLGREVGESRLCIASMSFHPVYSGAGERFKRYLPGLRARGLEVSVCTGTPDPERAAGWTLPEDWAGLRYGALLPIAVVEGAPVRRFRLPDTGFAREALFAWTVSRWCSGESERPDVVQLISNSPYSLAGLWRIRRLGIPTVLTYTMMPGFSGPSWKVSLLKRGARLVSDLVSCVVASRTVMRDTLLDMGLRARVEVIPNGVDTSRFRPPTGEHERAQARLRLGIPRKAAVLLWVGPIVARKRTDLLLEAWCELAPARPDLHLVVAGPRLDTAGPQGTELQRKIEALADRSGARDRLHFLGSIEDVEEKMRAADVFGFTSSREGMPNVVLEAMASGVPVVTTPFVGLPIEFGDPGQHFVLTGFDPQGIAREISELLAEREKASRLARNALSWVREHLSVDHSLDRYADLYHDLAGRH